MYGLAKCPGCGLIVCGSCYRDLKIWQEYEKWLMDIEEDRGESVFSLGIIFSLRI